MKRRADLNKRIGSILLCGVLVFLSIPCGPGIPAQAAPKGGKTFAMKTARALAVEESSAYFQVEETILSKQAALESAKKAIKLKQKNMSTFRWSPLLSFKFPTKPNEQESYEFQFKPVSIQAEIDEAIHKLNDTKISIYQEINTLYVEIVVLQETIAFNEQRLEALDLGIERNKSRLLTGDATQADVDKLTKKRESTANKVASDKRSLEAKLTKMSNKVGTDVAHGYKFETPFIEARIKRTQLPALIQYTLDNDQSYYEACMNETTARVSLNTNYSLMASQYGGDMGYISGFVMQALNGQKVNGKAFKQKYKEFLEKVDSYWQGKKRILFIKIPRVWFKGSLDGTRYIEDDPYVLYQDTLDYANAHTEKLDAEASLEEQVIDTFENYVSVKNSYDSALKDLNKAKKDLDADQLRNQIGDLSFEEYSSELDDYEEMQNALFDTMKTYSETLYAFDRLTCGGISALLDGTDASLQTGQTGTSHVEKEYATGAQYFLKQIIQSEAFELSIYVPEELDVNVTHYELWCDNTMIGERTEVNKRLRHLALAVSEVDEVKIRLYDEGVFVSDCVIDADKSNGPLPIVTDRKIVKTSPDDIGVYEISHNETTGMVTLKLTIPEDPDVKYYQIKTSDGDLLTGEEPMDIKKGLTYLSLLENSLNDLTIILMSESKTQLYEARFDTANRKIRKKDAE